MSLVPTVYASTDSSAPVLTGQNGSLLTVLKAILVDGYGAKTALGWTEPFTGSSTKRVFRNNVVSGTGMYLRILDDGSVTPMVGLVRTYATMSDIDTGTEPQPDPAGTFTDGSLWPKSITANSTARAWWAIGNERCIYFFADISGNGMSAVTPQFAGDFESYVSGNTTSYALTTHRTSYAGTGAAGRLFAQSVEPFIAPTVADGLVMLQNTSGDSVFAGISAYKTIGTSAGPCGASSGTYDRIPYPNATGKVFFDTLELVDDTTGSPRGRLPGVYNPLHPTPFTDLDTINDPEDFPVDTTILAKTFRCDDPSSSTNEGQVVFDIVNAW